MIKKFSLGGKKYKVKIVNSIDDTGLGRAYSYLNKIKISKNWNGMPIPKSSMEQTFYHELVHAILDEIGEKDLSGNETFVQSFSLLLHQFEKTKT